MTAAIASMLASNGPAPAPRSRAGVRCATDVTGFGLIGHLAELAAASGVGAEVDARAVPALPGARRLAAAGGGDRRRRAQPRLRAELVEVAPAAPDRGRQLLFDPQTSGGLLLAVPPAAADDLDRELDARGVPRWRVGRLTDGRAGALSVACVIEQPLSPGYPPSADGAAVLARVRAFIADEALPMVEAVEARARGHRLRARARRAPGRAR